MSIEAATDAEIFLAHADDGHEAYRYPGRLDGKVVEWMEHVTDEQYRR